MPRMTGLMDCNNFFVSCERLFRPDLLGKPVAVLSSNDGCIVARSEEVKKLGIPMGVPLFEVEDVVQKHGVVLFSSNFTLYRDLSLRVMTALREEFGVVSVYSIDEAFFEIPVALGENEIQDVRTRIMRKAGIPVSIGVACTQTQAKLASTYAKRTNGVFFLTETFLSEQGNTVPIGSVWGIGREMTATLTREGVTTVGAFLERGRQYALSTFGVVGERVFHELSGSKAGECTVDSGPQASITSTRSFRSTTRNRDVVMGAIAYHVAQVGEKLRERGHVAEELTVLAYPSRHGAYVLRQGSARALLDAPTDSTETLLKRAHELFQGMYKEDIPYKKAGVVVGRITPREYISPNLLTGVVREKSSEVYDVVDTLNERFGSGTVRPGSIQGEHAWGARRDMRSREYTTQWSEIANVKAV